MRRAGACGRTPRAPRYGARELSHLPPTVPRWTPCDPRRDVRCGGRGAGCRRGVIDSVSDARVAAIAGRQFNRISREQLRAAGLSNAAIRRRLANGRLVVVEHAVLAVAPALEHDPWGRWMAATLTHPGSALSRLTAAVASELLSREGPLITITRAGSGGPRRHGNVVVHRSTTLDGDVTTLNGIPITTVERTLVDIAGEVSDRALARAVREAVRLERTTLHELGDSLGRFRGRRGIRRLAETLARYSGLPLERARSGAEVRALEVLRDASFPMPRLNVAVAGEEADLSWPESRLIVEIDGGPFHLDAGEDARKEAIWRAAGWTVRRIPSDHVYEWPQRLLELAATPSNVPLWVA